MRPWRNKRITALLLFLTWTVILYLYFTLSKKSKTYVHLEPNEVLWWNVRQQFERKRSCGLFECVFSSKRSKLSTARAIIFYGSNLKIDDMPLPRRSNQIWALLHEESPRNVPYIPHGNLLRHFNITSTFSRRSNFPLTTQYLPHSHDLTSRDYTVSTTEKSRSSDASVVFLQSDCDTMSGREDYVRELMTYIPIHSFGSCLHNQDLPPRLQHDYLNNLYSPDLLRFLSRYKFIIAIENGVCDDYITEKFWRPLIVGTIPIYYGSPTIRDWAPNNKSAIYIDDFPNAKALAEFIESIHDNFTEYNSYRQHKLNRELPITNTRLLVELARREFSANNDLSIFDKFECFVCQDLTLNFRIKKMATIEHYNCPFPPLHAPLMKDSYDNINVWKSIMAIGRCQADILDHFWTLNIPYTQSEFDDALKAMVNANLCN